MGRGGISLSLVASLERLPELVCRGRRLSKGLPSAALQSRSRAYPSVADPSATAVWGGAWAAQTVWLNVAVRTQKSHKDI